MDNTNVAYLGGKPFKNFSSSQEPWFAVTDIMDHCKLDLILLHDLLEFVDSNNKKQVYFGSIENQENIQLWAVNTKGAIEMIENVERAVSNKFMEIMNIRNLR